MPFVLGALVRIYADDDSFDEGTICTIFEGYIDVEFYDWQQRWPRAELQHFLTWPDQREVLRPTGVGEVIRTFSCHRRIA